MHRDVTAVIPTIPSRTLTTLPRTLRSVFEQSHPVVNVSMAQDIDHMGAWHTRARALAVAQSTWVAFIDDDDEWYPHHLEMLLDCAEETQADYVFSWFDLGSMCSHTDQLGHFGKVFDPAAPHLTTMNILVNRELACEVGFTPPPDGSVVGGEDWRFVLRCVEIGAKIIHLPERTWRYNCNAGNTRGLPSRW